MNSQPELQDKRTVSDGSIQNADRRGTLLYINIASVCLREIQLAAGENERTNIISILDQTDIFPQKHSEHLLVMYLSLNSEKHIFEICTDGHHRRIPHC